MTPTELQQFLRDKLRKAYSLGQTWWQQADSEYRRENKKADETAAKFAELVENVVLAVTFELNRAGATEAAKATGTAGEQMSKTEIDTIVYKCRQSGNDTTYDIVNACLAARQPAQVVAVKTWQERARAYEEKWYRLPPPREVFMQDEIADLRAALAATNRSQP